MKLNEVIEMDVDRVEQEKAKAECKAVSLKWEKFYWCMVVVITRHITEDEVNVFTKSGYEFFKDCYFKNKPFSKIYLMDDISFLKLIEDVNEMNRVYSEVMEKVKNLEATGTI